VSSPSSPHDALFKATFGQPDLARSEFELVMPAEVVAHIDLSTLELCAGSFVDEDLRHAHTDLLYRARVRGSEGGEALVYVLFEHQSTFDALLPLRLLRYLVNVWETWARAHPEARLPIVLPVVLCHVRGGWKAAPQFAPLLDASPELLAAVAPYQPLFGFLLDDLDAQSIDALATRELAALARLAELAFWSARSLRRLEQAAPRMAAILAGLPRDERARSLLARLYVYVMRDAPQDVEAGEVRAILEQIAGPEGQEDVVNAAEQLIAEGIERGIRTAIGEVLAARSLNLSELGRARLAACEDVVTLTGWLKRAATASSEAEIFASP
jgi:predicted transposase/invertase (TIGR01784 family)